jgi:phage N-6-adenine-methyltransferase
MSGSGFLAKIQSGPMVMRVEEARDLLASCVNVDDIKEVRDRAMAVQMYARKKKAGEEAADNAGAIVVYATARLAQLYQQAPVVRGPNQHTKKGGTGTAAGSSKQGREAVAKASGMADRELRRWKGLGEATPGEVEAAIARAKEIGTGVSPATAMRAMTSVSASEDYDGDEWYTPPEVIARVKGALGGIDLDPASNAHAQDTVRAKRFFTKEDDGLTQDWSGRVFCNPPYSMPLIEQFTAKVMSAWEESEITAAVYLVNNCTDAKWQQALLKRHPVCFTSGRIGFLSRSGQKFATRQGQAIFYLGPDPKRFTEAFADMGAVLVPR